MKQWDTALFRKFALRDVIFLGFCATFIVVSRAGLRLHLNIPGHAMFFTMFFLILASGCVPKMWASTIVGIVAGSLLVLLGLGKEGPFMIIKFVVPGFLVDCCRLIYPKMAVSSIACAIVGIIGSASRFLTIIITDMIARVEWAIIIEHALITSLLGMAFGGLGALMVPPIIRRLQAHKLLHRG
jgi:hypothetical protein